MSAIEKFRLTISVVLVCNTLLSCSEPLDGGHDGVVAERDLQSGVHVDGPLALRHRLLQDRKLHLHPLRLRQRLHPHCHQHRQVGTAHLQGDTSGWLKHPVDLVPLSYLGSK